MANTGVKFFFIAISVLVIASNAIVINSDYNKYYRPRYQPDGRIFCTGMDVTKNCIYRSDGNYAIDNYPRPGYVSCTSQKATCMPCPYGLVFCPNAGVKKEGMCIERSKRCYPYPHRNYYN
nr:periculin-1-like [Hydra vulgaris]